jgi:hypothetical protein
MPLQVEGHVVGFRLQLFAHRKHTAQPALTVEDNNSIDFRMKLNEPRAGRLNEPRDTTVRPSSSDGVNEAEPTHNIA